MGYHISTNNPNIISLWGSIDVTQGGFSERWFDQRGQLLNVDDYYIDKLQKKGFLRVTHEHGWTEITLAKVVKPENRPQELQFFPFYPSRDLRRKIVKQWALTKDLLNEGRWKQC